MLRRSTDLKAQAKDEQQKSATITVSSGGPVNSFQPKPRASVSSVPGGKPRQATLAQPTGV